MASSVFKIIHSEKRSKIRDMNDVRTRASKRLKETRKSQREALLNLHRHVEIKPEVKKKKTEQEETLLRLKSYREEKLKRMEEQKKSQKPPFYSLVRVRHTGGTPFRTKHQAVKIPAVTLPPATRSRTAFQKEFVFKATLNTMEQIGSKQKDLVPLKSTAIKSRKNNKENQQPLKNNLKMKTKVAVETVKAPLVKDTPVLVNRKPVILPITTNRSVRQKEIATTINNRRMRQRETATHKNNVAASILDNVQKKKNEIQSKSDLNSRRAIGSEVKQGKGINSKNSNSKGYKIQEEVNNLLADKLAERVFIMSPVIATNISKRSTHRRPRLSTGNLMPDIAKTENVLVVEKRVIKNEEIQSKPEDESSNIAPEALRDKLEEETSRLSSLADAWSKRHTEDINSIPEQVKDEILAVVGQTRLLLSDKFQQFRSLINNALAEHKESGVVIKADDLLGFWEMMYLEVKQLNRKYENLASLAENGWHAVEKQIKVKKTKKRINKKKSATSASSRFKEFLKKKNAVESNYEEFNNSTLQVPSTPVKEASSLKRTLNCEVKTRRSSACNITLKKSFLAKAVLSPFVKS